MGFVISLVIVPEETDKDRALPIPGLRTGSGGSSSGLSSQLNLPPSRLLVDGSHQNSWPGHIVE